jgi:subtilisin family serine protease
MVADGIVVSWAAGNDGGDGSADAVNPYAKNPTRGVLSVANYDDTGDATRDGSLDPSSSRGRATDPNREDWPDVAAPGTNIISTGAKTGTIVPTGTEISYEPYYTTATGTSMASPAVCGVAALLLQANPSLTPADVEDVLEDHAHQFTTDGGYVADPNNSTTGTNFGAGHGLVDAIASLADPRVLGSAVVGSPLPQVSQHVNVYTEPAAGVGVDGQLVAGVQWTEPAGVSIDLATQLMQSGNPSAYPLSDGQAAAFIVVPPAGSPVTLPTRVVADSSGTFGMDAMYTFGSPGNYRVEAAADFGAGLVSFVSFTIQVL